MDIDLEEEVLEYGYVLTITEAKAFLVVAWTNKEA
jgi:hypothetical protein